MDNLVIFIADESVSRLSIICVDSIFGTTFAHHWIGLLYTTSDQFYLFRTEVPKSTYLIQTGTLLLVGRNRFSRKDTIKTIWRQEVSMPSIRYMFANSSSASAARSFSLVFGRPYFMAVSMEWPDISARVRACRTLLA
jgi:hypothetical protein